MYHSTFCLSLHHHDHSVHIMRALARVCVFSCAPRNLSHDIDSFGIVEVLDNLQIIFFLFQAHSRIIILVS